MKILFVMKEICIIYYIYLTRCTDFSIFTNIIYTAELNSVKKKEILQKDLIYLNTLKEKRFSMLKF